MLEVVTSATFDNWLRRLKDHAARGRIVDRIARLAGGNFGVCKNLGAGVSELRLNLGPDTGSITCAKAKP